MIDLMQGQVVHAKFGLRSQYLPIHSSLCNGSSPFVIVATLLELYPFQTLYIADLDAILGVGNHIELIELISKTHPQLTIWLDSGVRQANDCTLYKSKAIKSVIGSENIANLQDFRKISDVCENQHILSLDYTESSQLGINDLHRLERYWPNNTICMTLNAVGSGQGVDTSRLNILIQLNERREIPVKLYAAGGVRDPSDIQLLADQGIAGVLVASALHNQSISSQDLQCLHQI